METRHIKLDYEEALNAKKQLLSSELNILQTMKRVKDYRALRKKELITKNKVKTAMTSLKAKLNLILSTFPVEEEKPKITTRIKRINQEQNQNISNELEDIKSRLAELK